MISRTNRNIKIKIPTTRRSIAAHITKNEDNEEEAHDVTDTSEAEPTTVQKLPKKVTDKMTSFQSTLLNIMKNQSRAQNIEEFNPDKAFLLSFLPYLQRMDENQKIDLKIQFLQSVQNILNSNQTSTISSDI